MNKKGVVNFIHGWPDEQAQTAQALGLSLEFQDQLQDGSPGPEMVIMPAGQCLLGSPLHEAQRHDNETPHPVHIQRPFALGKYAVTFAEYDRFAATTGWSRPDDWGWGRGNRPVIHVTWFDAVCYADWLSEQTGQQYRLPQEFEWEYACRAGTTTAFWWGDDIDTGQANYDGSYPYRNGQRGEYRQRTVAVNEFAANPWGLYQMHGNVWEWTASVCSGSDEASPATDDAPRTVRGGGWGCEPRFLRAASRHAVAPVFWNFMIGFRLARAL